MKINSDIRKCVCFVGYKMADDTYRFAGSAFWVGEEYSSAKAIYAVTARHVIDGIRSKGLDRVYLRMNLVSGKAIWLESEISQWWSNTAKPNIDVAICATSIPKEYDHLVLPLDEVVNEETWKVLEVDLGDEVFIVGLFHHFGQERNIPIVRVGNLACLTEERIRTRDFGSMDAYLIEARSIGGLSGSPVFLNLGAMRVLKGELKFSASGPKYLLIGLMHGHYDVDFSRVDDVIADQDEIQGAPWVNTGIGVVVPIHDVISTIKALEDH